MKSKPNIGRIILGGLVAGIVIDALGYLVHGVILEKNYQYFIKAGSMLSPEHVRMMPVQILLAVLSGIPLAILYVIGRNYCGPGPKSALLIGALVGLMSLAGNFAMYSYYNFGGMIPAMSFANNFAGCVLGTFIAGMLYKDKAA